MQSFPKKEQSCILVQFYDCLSVRLMTYTQAGTDCSDGFKLVIGEEPVSLNKHVLGYCEMHTAKVFIRSHLLQNCDSR